MKKFCIEPSNVSPKVELDPDKKYFEISGKSRPENCREFFEPILDWITDFKKEIFCKGSEFRFEALLVFRLDYFNSSSAKFLLDILNSINELNLKGHNIAVNWYYENGDEDMLEAGEELSKMVKYHFNYIQY